MSSHQIHPDLPQFAPKRSRSNEVKRTQEEAEKEMLEILQNLEADGIWPQLLYLVVGCFLFPYRGSMGRGLVYIYLY